MGGHNCSALALFAGAFAFGVLSTYLSTLKTALFTSVVLIVLLSVAVMRGMR